MKKVAAFISFYVVSFYTLYGFNQPLHHVDYYEQGLRKGIINPITQAIIDGVRLSDLIEIINKNSQCINTIDKWRAYSWEGNDFWMVCCPLYAALITCNPEAAAIILAKGANPNLLMYSDSHCFLHLYNKIICGRSSGTIFQNFIELACDDTFLKSMATQRPDFHAVEVQMFQLFDLLISYGADTRPVNAYPGGSPLQCAFKGTIDYIKKCLTPYRELPLDKLPIACFNLTMIQRLIDQVAAQNASDTTLLPWTSLHTVYKDFALKLGAMQPARLKLVSSWICAMLQKLPK